MKVDDKKAPKRSINNTSTLDGFITEDKRFKNSVWTKNVLKEGRIEFSW
jgi:hypothetical protein